MAKRSAWVGALPPRLRRDFDAVRVRRVPRDDLVPDHRLTRAAPHHARSEHSGRHHPPPMTGKAPARAQWVGEGGRGEGGRDGQCAQSAMMMAHIGVHSVRIGMAGVSGADVQHRCTITHLLGAAAGLAVATIGVEVLDGDPHEQLLHAPVEHTREVCNRAPPGASCQLVPPLLPHSDGPGARRPKCNAPCVRSMLTWPSSMLSKLHAVRRQG